MASGLVPIYIVYPGREVSKRHPIYAKPKTLEELREQVCAEAKEMQTIVLKTDNFTTLTEAMFEVPWAADESHTYRVCHKDDEVQKKLNYPGDMVDISPVVGLIRAMIKDMDLEKFFTEMIDNSDEATARVKDRRVTVKLNREKNEIVIEDNGPGLMKQQIENMARPGLHEDKAGQYGSRVGLYGFGFNTAAWYGGNVFRIESKTANGKVVNMLTCDLEAVFQNNSWGARPSDRQAEASESGTHFTRIVIQQVPEAIFKDFLEENDFKQRAETSPKLLQKLADIYYTHMHQRPWFRPIDAIADSNFIPLKIVFEVNDPTASDARFYDGKAVFRLHDDKFCGESNLIHRVCHDRDGNPLTPLHLSFGFQNPAHGLVNRGRLQQTVTEPRAKFQLVLFYHKCDSGFETMPDKADYEKTLQGDGSTLLSRNPGLLVFWPTLGRMLPKGVLPSSGWKTTPLMTRLPFMERQGLQGLKIDTKAIGDRAFDRVKGFIFFNKAFDATEHKQDIKFETDMRAKLVEKLEKSPEADAKRQIKDFAVWLEKSSKEDNEYTMLEDGRKTKDAEEFKCPIDLGHPKDSWQPTLTLKDRVEFEQMNAGDKAFKLDDPVKIVFKKDLSQDKPTFGVVKKLYLEKAATMEKQLHLVYEPKTFRGEAWEDILLSTIRKIEKPPTAALAKAERDARSSSAVTRLVWSDKSKVKIGRTDKEWKPSATPMMLSTGDNVTTIAVESHSSKGLKIDPCFGVILEVRFNPPAGSSSQPPQRRSGSSAAGPSTGSSGGNALSIDGKAVPGWTFTDHTTPSERKYRTYHAPNGETFRSVVEVKKALGETGDGNADGDEPEMIGPAYSHNGLFTFTLDVIDVGEYTITAVGQDHTKHAPVRSLPSAKLIRQPGAAEKFDCKWIEGSVEPIVELGAPMPTVVVSLYDGAGKPVDPAGVEPTITCSLDGSTIALKVPAPKYKIVDGLLRIEPMLQLERPDSEQLSCVARARLDVQVTLTDGSRKEAGKLSLFLKTGEPHKLVIGAELEAALTSSSRTLARTGGLPAFEIVLHDAKGNNCVFQQGEAPMVHITKADGTPLIKRELRNDGSAAFDDGEVLTSGFLFGDTSVKLQAKLFNRAIRNPQPILTQPTRSRPAAEIIARLPPFAVVPRVIGLAQPADDLAGEVRKKLPIELAIFDQADHVDKDVTGTLTVEYAPVELSCGTSKLAVKAGRALLNLTPKVKGDASYILTVSVTCDQIKGAKLPLKIRCEPPVTAPHSLVVQPQLDGVDGSSISRFVVAVRDRNGDPVSTSISGDSLHVTATGIGCQLTQAGVVNEVAAKVSAGGEAAFADVEVSMVQPLQVAHVASIKFQLCAGQAREEISSVEPESSPITIAPSDKCSKLELLLETSDQGLSLRPTGGATGGLVLTGPAGSTVALRLRALNEAGGALDAATLQLQPLPTFDGSAWTGVRNETKLPLLQLPTKAQSGVTRTICEQRAGGAELSLTLHVVPDLRDVSQCTWVLQRPPSSVARIGMRWRDVLVISIVDPHNNGASLTDASLDDQHAELLESLPAGAAASAGPLDGAPVLDTFLGKPRQTMLRVRSRGGSGPLPSESLALSICHGKPHRASVNPPVLKVKHCEPLKRVEVALVDVEGNSCADSAFRVTLRPSAQLQEVLFLPAYSPQGGQVTNLPVARISEGAPRMPGDFVLDVRSTAGDAGHLVELLLNEHSLVLRDGAISGSELESNFELHVYLGVSAQTPLDSPELPVKVMKGTHPTRIELSRWPVSLPAQAVDLQHTVGEAVALEDVGVALLAEDGTRLVGDELRRHSDQVAVRSTGGGGLLDSVWVLQDMQPDSDQQALHFKASSLQATEAKSYPFEAIITALGAPQSCVRSGSASLKLLPGPAAKLVVTGASTRLPALVEVDAPLLRTSDGLALRDAFDNPVQPQQQEQTLTFSLIHQNGSIINGLGPTSATVAMGSHEGKVTTDLAIAGVVQSGQYTLVVHLGATELLPRHQFEYRASKLEDDERELQDELGQLREGRDQKKGNMDAISREIRTSEAAIRKARLVKEKAERAAAEAELAAAAADEDLTALSRLDDERNKILHAEHRNNAFRTLHTTLGAAMAQNGVHGVVAQFGCVEEDSVARTIERYLSSALADMLVRDDAAQTWLQQQFFDYNSAADAQNRLQTHSSAVALKGQVWHRRRWPGSVNNDEQKTLQLRREPLAAAKQVDPECRGYAVNLISLDTTGSPSAQELRTELWYPLLRYTLVFSSHARMVEFGARFPQFNSQWQDSSGALNPTVPRVSIDGGAVREDGRQAVCEPPPSGCKLAGVDANTTTPLDDNWRRRKDARDARQQNGQLALTKRAEAAQQDQVISEHLANNGPLKQRKSELADELSQLQGEIDQRQQALTELGAQHSGAGPSSGPSAGAGGRKRRHDSVVDI